MTAAEILRTFTEGMESLRSDNREDNDKLREDLGGRLDALTDKVAIQNGRVAKLELAGLSDGKEGWAVWLRKQAWLPWLVAFTIAEIGPKALPSFIANLAKLLH